MFLISGEAARLDGTWRRRLAEHPLGTSRQAAVAALLCYLLTCAASLLWPLQATVTPNAWSTIGKGLQALVAFAIFIVLLLMYRKMP